MAKTLPAGNPGDESTFIIGSVDLSLLHGLVKSTISALEQYNRWISSYGHRSVAVAEMMADSLFSSASDLLSESDYLWEAAKNANTTDTGLFAVVKVVREAAKKLYHQMPNDETLGSDEPFIIRLSENIEPVEFDEVLTAQLKFAEGAISELIKITQEISINYDPAPVVEVTQTDAPPLSEKHQKAFDLIKNLTTPTKGAVLAKRLNIKADTFRKHYVPALALHGVKNDGSGYYISSR